ncbi:hypothetical protein D3C76_1290870 [compost metagenome]
MLTLGAQYAYQIAALVDGIGHGSSRGIVRSENFRTHYPATQGSGYFAGGFYVGVGERRRRPIVEVVILQYGGFQRDGQRIACVVTAARRVDGFSGVEPGFAQDRRGEARCRTFSRRNFGVGLQQ